MNRIRLTMAQALVRFLQAQRTVLDGREVSLFAGIFAIFGHGNVAGLGEALYEVRETFPTLRGHNEQALAHSAIAFAKAHRRRRMFACTSSIGPGATNMVTAAALAHVNRLPVLFLPGDTFASRRPNPVLQQVESFSDPTVTANDCFRPVSRYWDRITRPEQLLRSLPSAMAVLTDAARCGPVTLALPQDVQAESFAYPEEFFQITVHRPRRPAPDAGELIRAADLLRGARQPLIIAGGGVQYSEACATLAAFAGRHGIPVAETQAGKGALPWDHSCNAGAIGVTGASAANTLAAEADLILAVGSRLSDFTTASRTLFRNPARTMIGLNVAPFDAIKHGGVSLIADARSGLEALDEALGAWQGGSAWRGKADGLRDSWNQAVDQATGAPDAPGTLKAGFPTDAQVLGAANRAAGKDSVVVCAAGGLPGELHKLWRAADDRSYHLEYGYSCMGYEIAGGLGVKMALPEREVIVLVGDGSYLMLNSEIATSVAGGHKLIIVVLDNGGFGCINRLQGSVGGDSFNNLFGADLPALEIDFAAHAASLGALSEKVACIRELEHALLKARAATRTSVIVIKTDPVATTSAGGAWWDVPVAQTSRREAVRAARSQYEQQLATIEER